MRDPVPAFEPEEEVVAFVSSVMDTREMDEEEEMGHQ